MPSSAQPVGARRSAALDGLRAIAALTVFVFHAWLYTRSTVDASAARDLSLGDQIAAQLRIGLVLFFVLSGFLLFRPWVAARLGSGSAPRTRTYVVHRVARIVPAYWLAIAGSVALLWPLAGEPGVRLPPAGSLPLFFIFGQNYSPETIMRLDPPMWTLGVEAAFYALLPLLGWAALRAGRTRGRQAIVPVLALALGMAFNVWLAQRAPSIILGKSLPAMLPYFAIGMLAAVLVYGRAPGRVASLLLGFGGLGLVVLDGWLHARAAPGSGLAQLLKSLRDTPAAIGCAGIVAVAVTRPPRALAARPLAVAGLVSYGLYLWHVPLLLWLRSMGLLPMHTWGATLVALPLSLLAAALSWLLVERAMISWSRRTTVLGANRRSDTSVPPV
ncbi:unannotated protein [freshwater metagenome]|uniref:Unannotated protein n=1 Tax=freshwater metagenome TaxID=449393 RepID=A0A6J7DR36_9ZZZZ|nr:acyltransferase family protein [Actinomycetota bacterium]